MFNEKFTKHKLTEELIRYDLKYARRDSGKNFFALATCLLVVVAILVYFLVIKLPFILALLICLPTLVIVARYTYRWGALFFKLHHALKNDLCITTDRLMGTYVKQKATGLFNNNRRTRIHTDYCLNFASYAEFRIPKKNYTSSEKLMMTDKGISNTSIEGDEFYVVLSKPHTGCVLIAYNCKLFQLDKPKQE